MILAQKQQQVLSQKMVMNQQMLNAVSLLNLSQEELEEEIIKETRRNPALIFKTSQHTSSGDLEESDKFQSFLENIQDNSYKTLQTYLLEQAKESISDEYILEAAEMIIQNLDVNGFNYVPIEELFSDMIRLNKITYAEIKKALHIVRRLEPIGCACSGFKQSLAVQASIVCESPKTGAILDIYKEAYELTVKIIKEHYEVLSSVQDSGVFIQKLARKNIHLSLSQAQDIFEICNTLTPYPGKAYYSLHNSEENNFIIPVAEIKKEDNEFKVILNDNTTAAVEISPEYLQLKNNPASYSKEEIRKAKDFINRAAMFMDVLEYRNRTVLKVLTAIVSIQHNFFAGREDKYGGRKKQGYLKPLRQAEIADITNLSISTVSRAVKEKYIRCEWGLFEIKDLFSNEVSAGISKDYVISQIEELLKIECGNTKRMSDSQIARFLKEQGIKISTRTVNKYRNELQIPSSKNQII